VTGLSASSAIERAKSDPEKSNTQRIIYRPSGLENVFDLYPLALLSGRRLVWRQLTPAHLRRAHIPVEKPQGTKKRVVRKSASNPYPKAIISGKYSHLTPLQQAKSPRAD